MEPRENRSKIACRSSGGTPGPLSLIQNLSAPSRNLVKPVRFEEVLARVRLRLRKSAAATSDVLALDDLRLELLTRRVTVGDHQVELTAREYTLLETFMRHPGQVLSREQLLSHVWGYDFRPDQ